jgi:diaminopimelate epimerase
MIIKNEKIHFMNKNISLPFFKMHGLGNNYVYIDGFKTVVEEHLLSELARAVSNPYTGIGSDGLIFIAPSSIAHAKMRIFNKDGSEGGNCGNGLRCIAKFLNDNAYAPPSMQIETRSGIATAHILHSNSSSALVSVDMGAPRLRRSEIPMLGTETEEVILEPFTIKETSVLITAVSMGNPHVIIFVDSPQHALHLSLGPQIEKDSRFPERTNVEFVYVESPHFLHCLIWERGSGATQACGTGACAVVVASVLQGISVKDQPVTVRLEGGDVSIQWKSSGSVWMTGPATHIASGLFSWVY